MMIAKACESFLGERESLEIFDLFINIRSKFVLKGLSDFLIHTCRNSLVGRIYDAFFLNDL